MRDVVHGHLARQLADRVGAHAVGHQKDVSHRAPVRVVGGGHDDVGVLIVTPTNPHVGVACVLNFVESNHPFFPLFLFSSR